MSNLKAWYTLDIDVKNAVRADFDFKKLLEQKSETAGYNIWFFDRNTLTDFYSIEWVEYMQSLDLSVAGTLIFWRQANFQHPEIHVDTPYRSENKLNMSINWCLGPDTSHMVWYKTPEISGTLSQTQTDNKYYCWPVEIGEEIDRHTIGLVPTLVRVDIPHNIIMGPESRLCVSCRLKFKPDTWEQTVAKVKKFIKE